MAAALALDAGVSVRNVDVAKVQRTLRAQGADPGDQAGPNADVPALAGEAMGASTAELGERIAQVLREGSAPEVQGSLMVQLAQVRGMMGR